MNQPKVGAWYTHKYKPNGAILKAQLLSVEASDVVWSYYTQAADGSLKRVSDIRTCKAHFLLMFRPC